jgi:zinc protease
VLSAERAPSPRFERIALSCGATLLFKRRPALPVASLSAVLHAGTSYENAHTNGLSCLTQRSMVKGTARRTSEQIAHESEFYGASIAPLYGHDSCGFSFSTTTRFFDRAFDVFADVIQNPAFPEPEVERERSLILAEIAQVEDEPFEKAGLEFQKALFASDPYGLPASGTAESMGSLSLAELRPWYERFHRVGNLLFTAAGDLDGDAIAAQIDSAFAGFRPGGAVLREATAGAPAAAREIVIERDVNQAVIVLGLRGPAIVSPDRYALFVMCSIMSGMGNRLFVEMRDKRSLCYYTGLFYRPMRRAGVIGAYVGTSPDKERVARETLVGELAKLIDEGVTDEEMERAKGAMIGHFAIGRQTNGAEAGLAARYELLGLGHEEIERYEERVLAVTRDEVRAAAQRWLAIDRLTIAVVRPRTG